MNRTDRFLIVLAALLLGASAGFFYCDGWMWGRQSHHDIQIVRRSSDVRVQIGRSQVIVAAKSWVVFKKIDGIQVVDLRSGMLTAHLEPHDRFAIKTNFDRPLELSTDEGARFYIQKTGKKIELSLASGEATIVVNGRVRRLTGATQVVLAGTGADVLETRASLKIVKPLTAQDVFSDHPTQLPLAWRWSGAHEYSPDDVYTVEFSKASDFKRIEMSRTVVGQSQLTWPVARSLNFYYRVRGPHGAISETEKANFTFLNQPTIVRPLEDTHVETDLGHRATVTVKLKHAVHASVWYQIARDPGFQKIVANRNLNGNSFRERLAIGPYFLRARAVYPGARLTGWTSAVSFSVELRPARLSLRPLARDEKGKLISDYSPVYVLNARARSTPIADLVPGLDF